ncbi:MAG TPA: cohesin domain-containing protein [Candidatus Limnocylindrales bacterium]|nr:cohesin domain-containing protein [Candidatus Limnocylindrales bacterium]
MKLLKTIKKSNKLKAASMLTVVAVLSLVAAFGSYSNDQSQAARVTANYSDTLSMNPTTGRMTPGQPVDVVLYANTGTEPINVVQVKVNYPADQLKFERLSEGPAFPVAVATDTATPGMIRLARTLDTDVTAVSGVSGSNIIATLHFTAQPNAGGTAQLSYDASASFVMRARDNQNMLATASGAVFTTKPGRR